EPNSLRSGLHRQLVTAAEQHQRMVTNVIHGWRIGFRDLLGQNLSGIRGVAESAGAREHVRKGVARSLDIQPLPLTGRNENIEVMRIGGQALYWPLFAPEFATDDAHFGAVIVGDLGNRARGNV